MKVVKVGNSLKLTLPSEICKQMKIQAGDMMYISANGKELTIRKAKP